MTAAPRLLISVRDADEAHAALAGGAQLIDIKEPDRGPLGAADLQTVARIIRVVRGERPVSAALGELSEMTYPEPLPRGLRFVKIGLAHAPVDWADRLTHRLSVLHARPVAVAYADHARAHAPDPRRVLHWAITQQAGGLLIDTYEKDGRSLFDFADPAELRQLIGAARRAGLLVALAGSLAADDLPAACDLAPDVVAMRTAACEAGDRRAAVSAQRVAQLREAIEDAASVADRRYASRAG